MTKLKCIARLLILTGTLCVWALGENVVAQTLENPGFEGELTNWAPIFDYDMSKATAEAAHSGNFGLRVTDDNPSSGSGLNSLPVEAVPGQKYEATFWARTVAGEGGLRVYLCFFDEDEKRLQKEAPNVLVKQAQEWRQFSVSAVAPERTVGFYLRISSVPLEQATVDLDDFSLKTINP